MVSAPAVPVVSTMPPAAAVMVVVSAAAAVVVVVVVVSPTTATGVAMPAAAVSVMRPVRPVPSSAVVARRGVHLRRWKHAAWWSIYQKKERKKKK
jgi:hypothetical protein